MTESVHIIAEAGTNHNGSLHTAKQLINVAIKSKADSVKFQIIYPEALYLPQFYQDGKYIENEVFRQRSKAMLKDQDYFALSKYCAEKEIAFSASVFDKKGIDLLEKLNPPYFKIASCDLNNSKLLMQAAERGRKLIVSTGMAALSEIEKALSDIAKTGNNDIVLMHCVSVYPARTEIENLTFLDTLKQTFGFVVGFSDHTESSIASCIAVSKGAQWIEKHLTLNRMAEGFDHAYAMEPKDFESFVIDVRVAEKACMKPEFKISSDELIVKGRARRALYAARDIQKGEMLAEADVLVVRPEGPLLPNDVHKIVGHTTKLPIKKYMPLSLDMFSNKSEN
jgi:N,N'-diacetyllegionaminate synthase